MTKQSHIKKEQNNAALAQRQESRSADAQKQKGSVSTFQFVDNRSEAVAERKLQQIANNIPHAMQLETYQKKAKNNPPFRHVAQLQAMPTTKSTPPIQRYAASEEGFLVSEDDNIVLKKDHSKELYATEDMLESAQGALEGKNVTNVELTAGGDWRFADTDFKQVVPKFKAYAGTKLTSKPKAEEDLSGASNRLYGKFALGWMYTMNFLSSCSSNPWYKSNLKSHKDALSDKGKAEAALGAIAGIQKKMQDAVAILHDIRSDIDSDAVKDGIKVKVTGDMGKLSAIGWDLLEKLIIYTSGDDIGKEAILSQVDERAQQLDADIAGIDEDSPYLPTSCGDLKNYLLANSDAIQNGGQVGDYHYIDYSEDDTEHGPWENHFASIIMKDGDDTVTLEDAAGQAEPNEKSHWYYMMYGTEDAQSFEEKTNAEYRRRADQRAGAIENSAT